jgi:hypothetical protein
MCSSGRYVGQNIITFPEEVGLNPLRFPISDMVSTKTTHTESSWTTGARTKTTG